VKQQYPSQGTSVKRYNLGLFGQAAFVDENEEWDSSIVVKAAFCFSASSECVAASSVSSQARNFSFMVYNPIFTAAGPAGSNNNFEVLLPPPPPIPYSSMRIAGVVLNVNSINKDISW
jgi:hypothetical protein